MKNLLFFALISALLFTSCGGDEDSVVGNWVAVSTESISCDDPILNIASSDFSSEPCTSNSPDGCIYASYTFTETMLTTVISFSFFNVVESEMDSGTYTIDGDQLTVCLDGECDPATYSIDGNTMTIVATDPDDGCVTTLVLNRQ